VGNGLSSPFLLAPWADVFIEHLSLSCGHTKLRHYRVDDCRRWINVGSWTHQIQKDTVSQDVMSRLWRSREVRGSKFGRTNPMSALCQADKIATGGELEDELFFLPRPHRISRARPRRQNGLPALQNGHHVEGTGLKHSPIAPTNAGGFQKVFRFENLRQLWSIEVHHGSYSGSDPSAENPLAAN
jgi:hypothetical protein